MVSYDEEDEDSDIFGESDRDDDEDDEDNTEVCPHSTGCLLHQPENIDFTFLFQNTGPSSFAEELAARIKGDAVIKAEGDHARKLPTSWRNIPFHPMLSAILACAYSLFVFLPCPYWEAITSKKKSKSRKGSKASKLQGMNFIHHHQSSPLAKVSLLPLFSFTFICCIVV